MVGEFIAHGSKLPLLKLESRGYDRSRHGLSPLSERSGHGPQAKQAGSVENDPMQTYAGGTPGAQQSTLAS
jgi:hypothetical protein